MASRLVGTSSATRTLDERDLATWRPQAAPKPRAPRKASNPALRQVTNGIVCFCGERFGEAEALEFMLHLRAEVGEQLSILDRRRQYEREYWALRRREDPEYRESSRKYQREHQAKHYAEIRILHQAGDHSRCAPSRCATAREAIQDPELRALVDQRLQRQQRLQNERKRNLAPDERERRNAQRRTRQKTEAEAATQGE